jgi:hypothetical protein
MLAVARATADGQGLSVEWREGRAEQLPFLDRPTAIAESRRVLEDGGRLWLSVWQSLDRHPFYQTLNDVIQRRLGMSALHEIFALGEPDQLRTLLEGAGFRRVEIEPVSLTARFPDPTGFLAGEIDVDTAAIPSMQGLDDRARQAIAAAISEDMKTPLREVTQDDHVVIQFHAYVAHADR